MRTRQRSRHAPDHAQSPHIPRPGARNARQINGLAPRTAANRSPAWPLHRAPPPGMLWPVESATGGGFLDDLVSA